MQTSQGLPVHAPAAEHSRTEVLRDRVAFRGELAGEFASAFLGHVDVYAALAAVPPRVERVAHIVHATGAKGGPELNHIGAKVREEARAMWARQHVSEIEYSDPFERAKRWYVDGRRGWRWPALPDEVANVDPRGCWRRFAVGISPERAHREPLYARAGNLTRLEIAARGDLGAFEHLPEFEHRAPGEVLRLPFLKQRIRLFRRHPFPQGVHHVRKAFGQGIEDGKPVPVGEIPLHTVGRQPGDDFVHEPQRDGHVHALAVAVRVDIEGAGPELRAAPKMRRRRGAPGASGEPLHECVFGTGGQRFERGQVEVCAPAREAGGTVAS